MSAKGNRILVHLTDEQLAALRQRKADDGVPVAEQIPDPKPGKLSTPHKQPPNH